MYSMRLRKKRDYCSGMEYLFCPLGTQTSFKEVVMGILSQTSGAATVQ